MGIRIFNKIFKMNEKSLKEKKSNTSEQQIRLSVAQTITIFSIMIGTIGTIAYGIASFLQTKYMVNELKESNTKIQLDISDLKTRMENLSDTININTLRLTHNVDAVQMQIDLKTGLDSSLKQVIK